MAKETINLRIEPEILDSVFDKFNITGETRTGKLRNLILKFAKGGIDETNPDHEIIACHKCLLFKLCQNPNKGRQLVFCAEFEYYNNCPYRTEMIRDEKPVVYCDNPRKKGIPTSRLIPLDVCDSCFERRKYIEKRKAENTKQRLQPYCFQQGLKRHCSACQKAQPKIWETCEWREKEVD